MGGCFGCLSTPKISGKNLTSTTKGSKLAKNLTYLRLVLPVSLPPPRNTPKINSYDLCYYLSNKLTDFQTEFELTTVTGTKTAGTY